jgi:hypothetical protein
MEYQNKPERFPSFPIKKVGVPVELARAEAGWAEAAGAEMRRRSRGGMGRGEQRKSAHNRNEQSQQRRCEERRGELWKDWKGGGLEKRWKLNAEHPRRYLA